LVVSFTNTSITPTRTVVMISHTCRTCRHEATNSQIVDDSGKLRAHKVHFSTIQ